MRDWLLAKQNSDGGWGYAPGKRSVLEPTALSLVALLGHAPAEAARGRALAWLCGRQLADGGFGARAGDEQASWATSLAVLALRRADAETARRERGLDWLRAAKGRQLESDPGTIELDGSLRGWSWFPDTFSWVEPTAYAMLAFKAEGRGDDPRVVEAEKLLLDRICVGGGWNYGNRRVLGVDLVPFDQVTAKALLALQDRRELPELRESAEGLFARDLGGFHATVTRAWVFLARAAWGRPVGERERAALKENLEADRELGTATLACAVAAIADGWPGSRPFELA